MEAGFDASKKAGLASFWSPAKTNVMPRNTRRGSNAQPAIDRACGGGRSHSQLGPEGAEVRCLLVWIRRVGAGTGRDRLADPARWRFCGGGIFFVGFSCDDASTRRRRRSILEIRPLRAHERFSGVPGARSIKPSAVCE